MAKTKRHEDSQVRRDHKRNKTERDSMVAHHVRKSGTIPVHLLPSNRGAGYPSRVRGGVR